MTTTTENTKQWQGPALLSYGFRPFFLFGSLWAVIAMTLWLGMLSGKIDPPANFNAVSWHVHELLFGYVSAILAGFMLTAVPNWTSRQPITGWPLLGFFLLWCAGRAAFLLSDSIPAIAVALIDLSCLAALLGIMAREVIASKNWRNLMVLFIIAMYMTGNALFHYEAAIDVSPTTGYGLRTGLSAVLLLIIIIGGRVVPNFTRSWLAQQGTGGALPAPSDRFDKIVMITSALAFLLWVAAPGHDNLGWVFLIMAGLHITRLFRWAGHRVLAEPLVLILHLAYLFIPMGFATMGLSKVSDILIETTTAQHMWMVGCIGVMTLAIMTRASLGHTGRALKANAPTVVIYGLIIAAALLRVSGSIFEDMAHQLNLAAAVTWVGAFGSFALAYGPSLLSPRADADRGS